MSIWNSALRREPAGSVGRRYDVPIVMKPHDGFTYVPRGSWLDSMPEGVDNINRTAANPESLIIQSPRPDRADARFCEHVWLKLTNADARKCVKCQTIRHEGAFAEKR